MTKPQYICDIDGLRAVAVLAVFFFHIDSTFLPGGFLGVDIFFAISGFLITRIIYFQILENKFSLRYFFSRRIKRLFPALIVMILLTTVASILLLPPETYGNYVQSARYAAAHISNFFFSRKVNYFDESYEAQPLLHTWSLGVEEQFYLFFPSLVILIIWILKRRSSYKVNDSVSTFLVIIWFYIIIGLFSLILTYIIYESSTKQAFYMLYSRAWEFCLGAISGLIAIKYRFPAYVLKLKSPLIIAILVLLVAFPERITGTQQTLIWTISLIFVTSSFLAISAHSAENLFLSSVALRALGRISYSYYLYHWPVIIFYKILSSRQEPFLIDYFWISLAVLVPSVVSYIYVEKPIRAIEASNRKVLLLGLVSIISCAFLFISLKGLSNSSWRIKEANIVVKGYDGLVPNKCTHITQSQFVLHKCINNDSDHAKSVALIGDSHSPHFFQGINSWAIENNSNVISLSAPGCIFLSGPFRFHSKVDPSHNENCRALRNYFKKNILTDMRITTVFLAQRFDLVFDGIVGRGNTKLVNFKEETGEVIEDHSGYYLQRLFDTTKDLESADKNIFLLLQAPVARNYNNCRWQPILLSLLEIEHKCGFDQQYISEALLPEQQALIQFSEKYNIGYFNPLLHIKNPIYEGKLLYANFDHLNSEGGKLLSPALKERINDWIK